MVSNEKYVQLLHAYLHIIKKKKKKRFLLKYYKVIR